MGGTALKTFEIRTILYNWNVILNYFKIQKPQNKCKYGMCPLGWLPMKRHGIWNVQKCNKVLCDDFKDVILLFYKIKKSFFSVSVLLHTTEYFQDQRALPKSFSPGTVRNRVWLKVLFRQMFGQVPNKLCIAPSWFIQLGIVTQGLEVGRECDRLCLLHLKPVYCYLKKIINKRTSEWTV